MAIPETQLETWCNAGATVTSDTAFTSVRAAIQRSASLVSSLSPDIYLQGSYGNGTNIYAESDVDVVVEYASIWTKELDALPAQQQAAYNANMSDVAYGLFEFRRDVIQSLQDYYGSANAKVGKKAVKVTCHNGRTVDVIPAIQHRKYTTFITPEVQSFIAGIRFMTSTGQQIVNYPKRHLQNSIAKNSILRTNHRYRQTVRMFKNARSYLINRGDLAADVAPSYFIECLIYNVPDHLFVASRQTTFCNVFDYVLNTIPTSTALCPNGQIVLFGNSSEQWTTASTTTFWAALKSLWENWY